MAFDLPCEPGSKSLPAFESRSCPGAWPLAVSDERASLESRGLLDTRAFSALVMVLPVESSAAPPLTPPDPGPVIPQGRACTPRLPAPGLLPATAPGSLAGGHSTSDQLPRLLEPGHPPAALPPQHLPLLRDVPPHHTPTLSSLLTLQTFQSLFAGQSPYGLGQG